MHEHGIADKLLREARAQGLSRGLGKISKIVIGVGALSGLTQEALAEPLHHAAAETDLGGVEIVFEKVPPAAVCRKCRKGIGGESACPFCGSQEIEVTEGTEAVVKEVN